MYVKAVKAMEMGIRLNVSVVPEGYDTMKKFPTRDQYWLSTYFYKDKIFDIARIVSQNKYYLNVLARLSMCNVSSLIYTDREAADIILMGSAIHHQEAGRDVSAGRVMKVEQSISYYYQSPIYSDLFAQKQLEKWCTEGVMTVIEEHFLK